MLAALLFWSLSVTDGTTQFYRAMPRIAGLTVIGPATTAEVGAVITTKLRAFEYCYNVNNTLVGPRADWISVSFVISSDGTVSRADKVVIKSSLPDPSLIDCTQTLIRRWRYSESASSNEVKLRIAYDAVPTDAKELMRITPGGNAEPVEITPGAPISDVDIYVDRDPTVRGAEEDMSVVNQSMRTLRTCYQKLRVNEPLLKGEVVVEISGDAAGHGIVNLVVPPNGVDPELAACATNSLSTLQFGHSVEKRLYRIIYHPLDIPPVK